MPPRLFALLSLSLALCLAPLAGSIAEESGDTVVETHNLEALGEQAHARRVPILIMFAQNDCPYCTIMEENYLRPILRSGEYHHKVIIRQVRIDDLTTLTDFDGSHIDPGEFTSRYHAWVTPTLVFLNSEGKEIVPKLVGIGTEGFFAGEIDNAIETALSKMKAMTVE